MPPLWPNAGYIVVPKPRGTTVRPTQATLDAAKIQRMMQQRIAQLEMELAEATEQLAIVAARAETYAQAVGFIATLKPDMVINADDPLAMMVEVHAHVTRERNQRVAEAPACQSPIVGNNATHARALTIRRREEP